MNCGMTSQRTRARQRETRVPECLGFMVVWRWGPRMRWESYNNHLYRYRSDAELDRDRVEEGQAKVVAVGPVNTVNRKSGL